LSGYNQYVAQKERELRLILNKLNEKNNNTTLKDEKILELQLIIHKLRLDSIRCEEIKDLKVAEIKQLNVKIDRIDDSRRYLFCVAKESKK
jgi:hypothetical protein